MKLRQPLLSLVAFLLTVSAVVGQNSKQELNDQLFEAARKGDAAAVTALLDKGADVNAKFRYGTTALFKASERGNTEVVKVLLARGADVTVKDTFYGATAMSWALDNDHVDVVRALLEKDAESVGNVLITGVREGKAQLVEMALARGGVKPEALTSALVVALDDKDNPAIAEMLKKAGAQPPPEIDASILQSYIGRYKSEQGAEIAFTLKDGKLFATPANQGPIALMALDVTTFKPTAFDGLVVTFTLEGDKPTGFTLKQRTTTTVFKRIEDAKP